MSSTAQIQANRENAKSSTGPRSVKGLIESSRNAITLGLYTINSFMRPGEEAEAAHHAQAHWDELNPSTPVQRDFAREIISASWRLRRCALIEGSYGGDELDPMQNEASAKIQASVDRARAHSHNILRRSLAELRRLQQIPAPAPEAGVDKPAPPPSSSKITIQTQPTPVTPAATSDATPRNATCPCRSGIKYKRCCGINAPAILNFDSPGKIHAVNRHA